MSRPIAEQFPACRLGRIPLPSRALERWCETAKIRYCGQSGVRRMVLVSELFPAKSIAVEVLHCTDEVRIKE